MAFTVTLLLAAGLAAPAPGARSTVEEDIARAADSTRRCYFRQAEQERVARDVHPAAWVDHAIARCRPDALWLLQTMNPGATDEFLRRAQIAYERSIRPRVAGFVDLVLQERSPLHRDEPLTHRDAQSVRPGPAANAGRDAVRMPVRREKRRGDGNAPGAREHRPPLSNASPAIRLKRSRP